MRSLAIQLGNSLSVLGAFSSGVTDSDLSFGA